MNRQLLASLIGMGIGITAVAHESAAAAPGEDGTLLANPELEAVGENGYATVDEPEAEVQEDTLDELLRLRIAIIDSRGNGSINEYVDGPTEAWRDRVSLRRLA